MTALQRLLPVDLSGRTQADWHEAVARSGGGKPSEGQLNGYSGHGRRTTDPAAGDRLLVCRCGYTDPTAIFAFVFLVLLIYRSAPRTDTSPLASTTWGGPDSLSPSGTAFEIDGFGRA